jgi:hypothetical protein
MHMKEYHAHAQTDSHIPATASILKPQRGINALAKKYSIAEMMNLGNGATTQSEQTVDEECVSYTTALLSPAGMDLIKFWEVCDYTAFDYHFYINIIVQFSEIVFLTFFAMALNYLPIQASAVLCK